jgi:hypothetical protein
MAYFLDWRGGMIGPAPIGSPTGYGKYDQLTHRIMRPQPGQLIQAISRCGHRVHEVPGRGEIDCAECLALLAEEATADPLLSDAAKAAQCD